MEEIKDIVMFVKTNKKTGKVNHNRTEKHPRKDSYTEVSVNQGIGGV
jgi:hypothetical protein